MEVRKQPLINKKISFLVCNQLVFLQSRVDPDLWLSQKLHLNDFKIKWKNALYTLMMAYVLLTITTND